MGGASGVKLLEMRYIYPDRSSFGNAALSAELMYLYPALMNVIETVWQYTSFDQACHSNSSPKWRVL